MENNKSEPPPLPNIPPSPIECPCPHAAAVADKMRARAQMGYKKYGKTVDRNDLTFLQWIVHLQEELMDATVYAQRLISLAGGMPNAPAPPGSDNRKGRCLSCGEEFNLGQHHVCFVSNIK
jgi:hypothetical protein